MVGSLVRVQLNAPSFYASVAQLVRAPPDMVVDGSSPFRRTNPLSCFNFKIRYLVLKAVPKAIISVSPLSSSAALYCITPLLTQWPEEAYRHLWCFR